MPHVDLKDPQALNPYVYVRNSPAAKRDPDGHSCASDGCDDVRVQASVEQRPRIVQNEKIRDENGTVVAKVTGVEGKLVDTVTVNGQPARGVRVTEANQSVDAKNGQVQKSRTVEGTGSTNADGQIADVIGIYHPTDGTKADNAVLKLDFTQNTWTSTDTQTLTLTLAGGQTCTATSDRTLTNAGPDGPSSRYTLSTTQPVVTPPKQ